MLKATEFSISQFNLITLSEIENPFLARILTFEILNNKKLQSWAILEEGIETMFIISFSIT